MLGKFIFFIQCSSHTQCANNTFGIDTFFFIIVKSNFALCATSIESASSKDFLFF